MSRAILAAGLLASVFLWGMLPFSAESEPVGSLQDSRPILIVTGMKREAAIAAGPGVVTVLGGAGLEGAADRLRQALASYGPRNVRAVISFGIGAALVPELRPGQLELPAQVVHRGSAFSAETAAEDRVWDVDPRLADALRAALVAGGFSSRTGNRAVSNDHFELIDRPGKEELHRSSGAEILDDESNIAAEFAAANGLPFAVLRVVDESLTTTLPSSVLHAIRADGSIDVISVFKGIARDPAQLPQLLQAARDSKAAFGALTRARAAIHFDRLSGF